MLFCTPFGGNRFNSAWAQKTCPPYLAGLSETIWYFSTVRLKNSSLELRSKMPKQSGNDIAKLGLNAAFESKFLHFTIIADVVVGQLRGFTCSPGPAYMGMQVWAKSVQHIKGMVKALGREIGFEITGDILIYKETTPKRAPQEHPFCYDIIFKPYKK